MVCARHAAHVGTEPDCVAATILLESAPEQMGALPALRRPGMLCHRRKRSRSRRPIVDGSPADSGGRIHVCRSQRVPSGEEERGFGIDPGLAAFCESDYFRTGLGPLETIPALGPCVGGIRHRLPCDDRRIPLLLWRLLVWRFVLDERP